MKTRKFNVALASIGVEITNNENEKVIFKGCEETGGYPVICEVGGETLRFTLEGKLMKNEDCTRDLHMVEYTETELAAKGYAGLVLTEMGANEDEEFVYSLSDKIEQAFIAGACHKQESLFGDIAKVGSHPRIIIVGGAGVGGVLSRVNGLEDVPVMKNIEEELRRELPEWIAKPMELLQPENPKPHLANRLPNNFKNSNNKKRK